MHREFARTDQASGDSDPAPQVIAQFERRLVELGCPARELLRQVREIADHYEDLEEAVLIEQLGTNAPAYAAGLRKGDLILELNHRPAVKLKEFRRDIDQSRPGTLLPARVYRDGQTLEYKVAAGRETYRRGGEFRVVVPTVVHRWDLWPNPGFSLLVLGYQPSRNPAEDLEPKRPSQPVYAEDWSAFAGVLDLSVGKRILSQDAH
ncbi:MAG: PDZ domain-containing protein [Verrucomicrobiota bacterium]